MTWTKVPSPCLLLFELHNAAGKIALFAMQDSRNFRLWTWLAPCVLVLLVAAVYLPAGNGSYLWDDIDLLWGNKLVVTRPTASSSVGTARRTPTTGR